MDIRIDVPIYILGDGTWPEPLEPFGVKNTRTIRYRQNSVGEYTRDPAFFIGIVSSAQFQPQPAIEYVHFGTTVRFITVTIAGAEERHTPSKFEVLIVAPESDHAFAIEC